MKSVHCLVSSVTLAATVAQTLPASAQDFGNQLAARQGEMRVMALNLGILGAMAQGKMPYDADIAQIAADNVVVITELDQTPFWPEGSDSMSIDNTRAEPAIWDRNQDFLDYWALLGERAPQLQAAAGEGQAALGPALGAVGGVCGDCHEDFQTPRN